jgi:hypothetical protein
MERPLPNLANAFTLTDELSTLLQHVETRCPKKTDCATESVLPIIANARTDVLEPNPVKSKALMCPAATRLSQTLSEAPSRVKLRELTDDPRTIASNTLARQ